MMKKVLVLALLTVAGLQARCNEELDGVVGTFLVDPVRNNLLQPLPIGLSLSAGTLFLNNLKGCYTLQNACLTIRDVTPFSFSVASQFNGETCTTLPCNLYRNFSEAVLQVDVVFEKCFKSRPVIVTGFEIHNPFGAGCPLVCGGTVICGQAGNPIGYVHDVTTLVTNVTNTGFTFQFDAKFVLQDGVSPQGVINAFIQQGQVFLSFHAIAGKNC